MDKTLSQLAKEILNAKGLPHLLADKQVECATIYASYTEEYATLQVVKAEFWNIKEFDENGEIRKKPLSDKAVEMKWNRDKNGKKELKLKYILKGLEKLLSAVKSALYVATNESNNQS